MNPSVETTPRRPQASSEVSRGFLYLTAALTGAAILIVEILGAKMLSPYFGTSHFVWTAQITVTLLSLAIGYAWGGRWADRSPRLQGLYKAILFAALYLAVATLFTRTVSESLLQFKLELGSILAAAFLFFVPLTLLAATGPFLTRYLASDISGLGGLVGRLGAIGTVGSVMGTLLAGYVLIPLLPNGVTMLIVSGVLSLVSLTYFAFYAGRPSGALVTLLLLGLLTYPIVRSESRVEYKMVNELARWNSNFGLMQVIQEKQGSRRTYLNDYLVQNSYDVELKKSLALFTYMLYGLSRDYHPNVESALCLGMGIGIVPTQLARDGVKVDVVEINEKVIALGEQFFDLDPTLFKIHHGDARYFLHQTTNRYDLVVLDTFLGDGAPSHLMTLESFAKIKKCLKPEGLLVMNSFAALGHNKDFLSSSLDKTMRTSFSNVKIHASHTGNIFYVASNGPLNFVNRYDLDQVHPNLRPSVEAAMNTIIQTIPENGRVLTDAFNPADFYDAPNRERLRKDLALQLKDL